MACGARFLVCPPEHYRVEYVINPWMEGNVHRADREKAAAEWQQYFDVLSKVAETAVMTPRATLPDLVFTANGGLVLGGDVILGHFLHRERRPEEPWFREWFEQNGFNVRELPRDLPFKGEGDALWDGARGILWAAYGLRTELLPFKEPIGPRFISAERNPLAAHISFEHRTEKGESRPRCHTPPETSPARPPSSGAGRQCTPRPVCT
jgi:hypothetical protein